jgi:hypothetical protein
LLKTKKAIEIRARHVQKEGYVEFEGEQQKNDVGQ